MEEYACNIMQYIYNKAIVDSRLRLPGRNPRYAAGLADLYWGAKFGWNRCSSFDCYALAL